jgi:hypothetical protein
MGVHGRSFGKPDEDTSSLSWQICWIPLEGKKRSYMRPEYMRPEIESEEIRIEEMQPGERRSEGLAATMIFAVVLLFAIGATIYALTVATDAIIKITVAALPAVIAICGTILKHSLDRARESESADRKHYRDIALADRRHRRDIELADRKHARELELSEIRREEAIENEQRQKKREVYAGILNRLSDYVRFPQKNRDEFATAFLHTWLIGSDPVVVAVQRFFDERTVNSLDSIVKAMRSETGLPKEIYTVLPSGNTLLITSQGLYPPKESEQPPDHLRS